MLSETNQPSKKLVLFSLIAIFGFNSLFSQKSDLSSLAIAGGITIGLAALLSNNGDNAQDLLESEMLDHILSTETVKLPQMLHIGLVNKPLNKQDYIKANCFIFNVIGSDFGHYIYIMVLGNYKFRNSEGFSFKKLVYLKFDKPLWEQNGIAIINNLLLIKKNTIKTNKFEAINSNGNKMDSVNFFDLKKITDDKFIFSKQSADDYEIESYFDKIMVAEDNHVLFNVKPDLNHPDQKFIFDYSELQMNIFIPLLGESVFLTNREFISITEALKY
jgi:hypothetical protein